MVLALLSQILRASVSIQRITISDRYPALSANLSDVQGTSAKMGVLRINSVRAALNFKLEVTESQMKI